MIISYSLDSEDGFDAIDLFGEFCIENENQKFKMNYTVIDSWLLLFAYAMNDLKKSNYTEIDMPEEARMIQFSLNDKNMVDIKIMDEKLTNINFSDFEQEVKKVSSKFLLECSNFKGYSESSVLQMLESQIKK